MSTVRKLIVLLPVLALALGGCSSRSISLLKAPILAPTATPEALATQAPSIAGTGYDAFAGNCVDAANEDAALISYANSQNYNADMQLTVNPTVGCAAAPTTGVYKTFIRQVATAHLTMNDIGGQLVAEYESTRDTFLSSLLSELQKHYPNLSNVTILVTYGGQARTTLSWNGRGVPSIVDGSAP
jgi:hypothetical protein